MFWSGPLLWTNTWWSPTQCNLSVKQISPKEVALILAGRVGRKGGGELSWRGSKKKSDAEGGIFFHMPHWQTFWIKVIKRLFSWKEFGEGRLNSYYVLGGGDFLCMHEGGRFNFSSSKSKEDLTWREIWTQNWLRFNLKTTCLWLY